MGKFQYQSFHQKLLVVSLGLFEFVLYHPANFRVDFDRYSILGAGLIFEHDDAWKILLLRLTVLGKQGFFHKHCPSLSQMSSFSKTLC